MGWTTTKVPKYYTRQQFMDSLFKYDTDKASSEMLAALPEDHFITIVDCHI